MKKNNSSRRPPRVAEAPIPPSAATSAEGRLADHLRLSLENLAAGAQLPPVRALSARYKASPVTVHRALARLAREGRVVARPGSGTFVTEPPRRAAALELGWQALALGARPGSSEALPDLFNLPRPAVLPLGSGYFDETVQPLALLRGAAARVAKRPSIWARLPPEGIEPLRAWFGKDAGGAVPAQNIVLAPGGQAALSTTLRALVPPGGKLIVESPTYFGVMAIARAAGITVVPVPADQDGVIPSALEEAFTKSGAKVAYLQPTFHNPTGAVLSPDRRSEILTLAKTHGAFIVEDDYGRDLAIDGPPLPPLLERGDGHVVYVRSLTKSAAPGLRVAAIAAFGPALVRIRQARAVDDWFQSGVLQEIALELVSAPGWARHLRAIKSTLYERRQAALAALADHFPEARVQRVPSGGFSLWVALPAGTDEARLVQGAERAGVQVTPGRPWFPAEPLGPYVRLSYAAAGKAALQEGVGRLREAWVALDHVPS